MIERLSAWLKGHESPHYLAAIEKEWSLPAAGNYEAKNSNYKVRLVPETTHSIYIYVCIYIYMFQVTSNSTTMYHACIMYRYACNMYMYIYI